MQDLVCDSRHKVWHLAFKLSELNKSDVNDVVHEAVMYIINNDKLYHEVECIIENGGSFRGFLFNVFYLYLKSEIRNTIRSKDALNKAKSFSDWQAMLDTHFPFTDDRAAPFSGFGSDEIVDIMLYRNGVFQKSCEDEYELAETTAIANDIFGADMVDMLKSGMTYREIACENNQSKSMVAKTIKNKRKILKKKVDKNR